MKYNSLIEQYYFTERYDLFIIELGKFVGAITRKYFPGFKQNSYVFSELKSSIIAEIFLFMNNGHYEATNDIFKLYQLVTKYDLWNKIEEIYKFSITSKKTTKKVVNHLCRNYNVNDVFKTLELDKNEETATIPFLSYLNTQIRGELTKFFNKYNKRRKTEVQNFNFEFYCFEEKALLCVEVDESQTDDKLEDILKYVYYGDVPKYGFKNLPKIKILLWKLYKKYKSEEH